MPNIIKQKAFNERMGKASPRHMKRKSFAAGGATNLTSQANPSVTALGGPTQSGINQNATNPNTGVLGTVGAALGLNNNFQAGAANLTPGTNTAQLNTAYTGAQQGIGSQNGLVNTFIPGAQSAVQNQNAVAQQELNMLNGTGPNPAQAQLAQATGQNVANQAALAASQRGASGNVGLLERQAAQTGAAAQQQSAGQAATLEAQQQIAAQQNLANLAAQQAGQAQGAVSGLNTTQQNEQNLLQNANTALNNANVSQQSNINNTNASTSIANQQMAGGLLGGIGSGVSSAISNLLSKGGEVSDHVKLAEMNAHSLAHSKNFASGGATIAPNPLVGNQTAGSPQAAMVPQYTQVATAPAIASAPAMAAPSSNTGLPTLQAGFSALGDALTQPGDEDEMPTKQGPTIAGGPGDNSGDLGPLSYNVDEMFAARGGEIKGPHQSHVANFLCMKSGGQVPAKVSPNEIYLRPDQVKEVIHNGANPLKIGFRFPGKAKVKGDSRKNDNIPTTLEDGGVVIKRSIVNKNDPNKARLFVHDSVAKRGNK